MEQQEPELFTHRCKVCGSAYALHELLDVKVPVRVPDCCVGQLTPLILAIEKKLVVFAAFLQQQLLLRSRDEQRVHLDKLADIAIASNNPGLRKAAIRYRNKRFES